MLKIGMIQLTCCENLESNFDNTLKKIKEAAAQGAQIICLPELFRSLYFCATENYDHFQLAESVPGPSTNRISSLAAELEVVIVAPLFEKRAPGLYHNTTAVIDADGSYLGKYRKMHIPDDPGFFEKFYFTPGDLGYQVFETRFGKIGILICWDQWFPESARITALKGAEILFFPTAIGWASSQNDQVNVQQFQAWQITQRAHAIANGIPVVAVNRVGIEGQIQFWGGSFIANPFGELLCQANQHSEEILVQQIDLDESDHYRTHWPFLRDRRIDSYDPILQRFLEKT